MSSIQFEFNPLTPIQPKGKKIPWALILIGLGLSAVIIAMGYLICKPNTEAPPLISDEEKLRLNDQNQQPQKEPDSKEVD